MAVQVAALEVLRIAVVADAMVLMAAMAEPEGQVEESLSSTLLVQLQIPQP